MRPAVLLLLFLRCLRVVDPVVVLQRVGFEYPQRLHEGKLD